MKPNLISPRRQWLRTSLGLSAGAMLGGLGLARFFNDSPDSLEWRERALHGFGTTLWLRAGHASARTADAGLDAAVAALRHVEAQMSLFDPDSAVSQLNRTGELRNPDPHLVAVLRLTQEVAAKSEGAFDVTVQPLWATWSAAAKAQRLPSLAELNEARQRVNWQALSVSPERIHFAQPGMAITLNGIAQGYAADQARATLQAHGIGHALLDTGEWSPLGNSPANAPWQLGIADPHQTEKLIATLTADGRSIATSSDNHTTFTADCAHHHLFDPRTGDSPPELSSVTVLAPSCALADALTKVLFVAGPTRAAAVAATWQVDALWVDKTGLVGATEGLARVLA